MPILKAVTAVILISFLAATSGCQRSGPGQSKPSQSIPDSKTLAPVKQAVESAEHELERREEEQKREQEKELDRLEKKLDSLGDQVSERRRLNDWTAMLKAIDELVETRLEYLRFVEAENLGRKLVSAHKGLAWAYEDKGDPLKAESHYKLALKFALDNDDQLYVYKGLFRLYLRHGHPEKAMEMAKLASPLAVTLEDKALWRLAPARVSFSVKRLEETEATVQAYLKELEGQETPESLEARMDCYELLADVCWERDDREGAARARVSRTEIQLQQAKLKLSEIRAEQRGKKD